MKVSITFDEIKEIVRNMYNLAESVEIEIEFEAYGTTPKPKPIHPHAIQLHDAFVHAGFIDPLTETIFGGQIIPAIKMLREMVKSTGKGCGLASCKHAVEDWKVFLEHVQKNGYPVMDGWDTSPWR
jgi:hypothetical protein